MFHLLEAKEHPLLTFADVYNKNPLDGSSSLRKTAQDACNLLCFVSTFKKETSSDHAAFFPPLSG